MFTLTGWYTVPTVWLPIALFLFFRSAAQFAGINTPVTSPSSPLAIPASGYAQAAPCFALGVVIWTLLEYTLHRFLFHVDEWLPDHPAFLTLHFLLHGVHHYLPMDRYVPVRFEQSHADIVFPAGAWSCRQPSSSCCRSHSRGWVTRCSPPRSPTALFPAPSRCVRLYHFTRFVRVADRSLQTSCTTACTMLCTTPGFQSTCAR